MLRTEIKIVIILVCCMFALCGWHAHAAARPHLLMAEFISGFSSGSNENNTGYLPVKWPRPASKTVLVDYLVSNGTDSKKTDYIFEAETPPFKPGETAETVPVAIKTDDINELDEPVEIALLNPEGATLREKKTPTLEIIDSNRQALASVKDFGAKGDGVSDDTVAVQRAINKVYAKGGGVVFFPTGKYLITSVTIRENITYSGDNATIIRPPLQGKWVRTFNTDPAPYSGSIDSRPLIIQGLHFEGNRHNQGPYLKYELEQAHMIFLIADAKKSGRLKVIIENCVFKDGVADAISVNRNVDLLVQNCSAENVFRGGLTVTGGYSRIVVKNFTTQGPELPTGIDFEVDGSGYGGSLAVEASFEDVNCIHGDVDLGMGPNSKLVALRLRSGRPPVGKMNTFSLVGRGVGTYEFFDCTFYVGYPGSSGQNMVYYPGTASFTNCDFIATQRGPQSPKGISAFPSIVWNSSTSNYTNQNITFNNCKFTSDSDSSSVITSEIAIVGVRYDITGSHQNNSLIFNNCLFTERLDSAVYGTLGGKLSFNNTTFSVACRNVGGRQRYPIWLDGYNSDRNWDVTIDKCIFNTSHYLYIYGYNDINANILRQSNITIKKSQNLIGTKAGINGNTYDVVSRSKGPIMRTILAASTDTSPPDSSVKGFKSADSSKYDIYVTGDGVRYKCTGMDPFSWAKE